MSIDDYRRGYEKGVERRKELEEEGFSDIPENFVKGIGSVAKGLLDIFLPTNEDEERGYQDGLEGNDFNR